MNEMQALTKLSGRTVFDVCVEQCKGTDLDPERLADWLINQGDPSWLVPAAARRWAQIIDERGFPNED